MNPLLVLLQPRIIPEFITSASSIKNDKLWVRFYNLDDACQKATEFFLDKRDYTHMAILTDDIIFNQDNFDTLKQDIIDYHYDVISGWSNGNTTFGQNDSNISLSLPPENPHRAKYQDYNFLSIEEIEQEVKSHPVIPVKHSGLILSFISRRIVQKVPFRTDYGCCRDAMFSNDIYKNNIIQYCDLRVRLKHLKKDDTEWFPLEVGKREPELVFEHANQ